MWVENKRSNESDYPRELKRARLMWTFIFTVSIFFIVLFFSVVIIRIQHSTVFSRLDSRLVELANLPQKAADLFRFQVNENLPRFLYEEGQFLQVFGPDGTLRFSIGEPIPDDFILKNDLPPEHLLTHPFQTIEHEDENGTIKTFRTYTKRVKSNLPGLGNVLVMAGIDMQMALEEKNIFRNRVIFFICVFPFLSCIIAYILAGMVLSPVKESYNLLRRFSFDASHELKTPLAIIQMSTGMLLSKGEGYDEATLKKISTIENASRRMDTLVKQLLQLAKAQEYSKNTLKTQRVHIGELLKGIVEEYNPYAEKRRIKICLEGVCEARASVHRDVLRTIIGNILENAIKFSPEDSVVNVTVKQQKNHILVCVKDQGPGIHKTERDKIFDRFYKADKSRHNSAGSGMGLSIAKEYAKKSAIKVYFESVEGAGTQFFIRIPFINKSPLG